MATDSDFNPYQPLADTAAESGTIMRDERYKSRSGYLQIGGIQFDVFQVLRHKDRRRPDGHDDQATEHKAESCDK